MKKVKLGYYITSYNSAFNNWGPAVDKVCLHVDYRETLEEAEKHAFKISRGDGKRIKIRKSIPNVNENYTYVNLRITQEEIIKEEQYILSMTAPKSLKKSQKVRKV